MDKKCRIRHLRYKVSLRSIAIDRVAIPRTNRLKILGVTLDRTLNFKAHCKTVKKACASRLWILQMIGAKLPRGKRSSLLQVSSAIIMSKLIYGIALVGRGGQATLGTLAPAYNKMVQFASGAFVTSPIASVMAESCVLPFQYLEVQSIARTAIRLCGKDRSIANFQLIRRVSDRIQELTSTTLPTIAPLTRRSDREWHRPTPVICWDVKKVVRADDSRQRTPHNV